MKSLAKVTAKNLKAPFVFRKGIFEVEQKTALSTPVSPLPGNLRTARERCRLSQRAVGEAIGVSEVTVSNHERGATTPSPALLQKYAELYGIEPAQLQYSTQILRRWREAQSRDGEEGSRVIREPVAHFAPAMPRDLRAMAHRFLADAHEAGADDAFLRYARHSLEDPELAEMYAGGLDEEGHPMTAEEQRDDYEAIIDALRLIMKRRLARAQKR